MSLQLESGAIVAGRYRLERLLGEGGMGAVWAATHTVTNRRYALKFLKSSMHARAELRRRFAREARAASAVEHPNVVNIHDVFELEDETPVMVMDLLEGESLRARVKRDSPMPLEVAAGILLPAVSAVGAAHAVGVVHRDIKPDNIFLEERPGGEARVRVLDFGIAKLTELDGGPDTGVLTGTGALLGTPVYMSPEQGFGERDIDHRTDVWALGVLFYEMLSGIRPVEGENIGQVLKRLLSDGITPLEVLEPDLPEEVTRLVGSMLARERGDRPADLREVAAVLRKYTTAEVPDFGPPAQGPSSRDEISSPVHSRPIVVGQGAAPNDKTQAASTIQDTHGPTSISVSSPRPPYGRYAVAVLAIGVVGAGLAFQRGGERAAASEPPAAAPSAAAPAVSTLAGEAPTAPGPSSPRDTEVSADAGAAVARAVPTEASPAAAPAPAVVAPRAQLKPRVVRAPSVRASRPAPPPAPAPAPAPVRKQGLVDEPPF